MPVALIVEDDAHTRATLRELVEAEGFATLTAGTLADAREQLAQPIDIVLLDLMLPDGPGLELLRNREIAGDTQAVVITGNATIENSIEALRLGATDYLLKPFSATQLNGILSRVVRPSELKAEVVELREELRALGRFGKLVGTSPPMQRLYDEIARVAPTGATVLVTGESGTGKELVAETVHMLSRRHNKPFLAVNCGAISPHLHRERALRPREGQLHRGAAPAPGLLRARARRHALPRRSHRDAARAAGQAPARARVAHRGTDRRERAHPHRRARDRGHQPQPARRPSRRASCDATCCIACRCSRCTSCRCASASTTCPRSRGTSSRSSTGARKPRRRSRRRRSSACGAIAGRATCASCGTWCSARSSWPTATSSPSSASRRTPSCSRTATRATSASRSGPSSPKVEERLILTTLQECATREEAAKKLGISIKTLYNRLRAYSSRE